MRDLLCDSFRDKKTSLVLCSFEPRISLHDRKNAERMEEHVYEDTNAYP